MFYDYYCPECGHVQEEIHGMTETPDIKCFECSSAMKILVTGGCATHLKGSGWVSKPRGDSSRAKRVTQTVRQEQISGE